MKNTLTNAQSYALISWAMDNVDTLEGMTDNAAAFTAADKLGFDISPNNITKIRMDKGIPVTWNCSRNAPTAPEVGDDFKVLVEQMARVVSFLEDHDLYDSGDEFEEMAKRVAGFSVSRPPKQQQPYHPTDLRSSARPADLRSTATF